MCPGSWFLFRTGFQVVGRPWVSMVSQIILLVLFSVWVITLRLSKLMLGDAVLTCCASDDDGSSLPTEFDVLLFSH